jgi:hypothetical protein
MPEMTVSTAELRELIEDAMRVRDERTTGQFNVIDCKLDLIGQRLDKLNGTVAKHEKIINERAVIVADYMDHIKESANTEKRIRTLEDQQLSNSSIKKWIVTTVGVTGALIGIVYTLLQFFVLNSQQ